MIKPLSPGQSRLLPFVAKGWTYQAIADHLHLSRYTVRHTVERIGDLIEDHEVEDGIAPYRRVQRWALTTHPPELST